MDNSTLDKEDYEKMVNLTPQILYMAYFDGKIKYANPAFNNVFGYSNCEVKELNIFSIIHPDDKNNLNNTLLLAHKEQQDIVNLEFRYKCKDGNFKWLSWNIKFEWDKGIIYGAGRDVSNKRDLEQTVYESNEKLNAIIENISEALFIFDKDGNYTTLNKSARDIFPSTVDNFSSLGASLKDNKYYDISGDLIAHEDMPGFRILRGEKISGYRVMKTNNTSVTFYDINGTPIYDDTGNFIAGIQCLNNVTENVLHEKILQSQFDLLHKTIDTLDLPFIRLSYPDFSITDINQKALNIIEGLNPKMNSIDIVKGRNYTDIITEFDKTDVFYHFQMIKDKKETSYIKYKELIIFGEKTFVNVLYQPILGLEGDIKQVIAIILDITKETRAKLQLEKNLKMQEEFFINISHEIKTPLNVIFSTTQLFDLYMKNNSLIENQGKLEKYIKVITQNCNRQSKLVNNLVDLSKIQSGFFKLHMSNTNIVSVVEEIVQSVSEYVENKGLKIIFDTDIEEKIIACDPTNIERVMLNLISNAIKFSMQGDEIFVNIHDKVHSVEIFVKDTGIGIESAYLDVIFERFRQVDKSLFRNVEGSGIGLCLVKSIVELHGGSINLESEIGKGSKFTIELPNRVVSVPSDTIENKSIKSDLQTINIEFSDIYS
ncbi:PAS domain S-box protein [Clostridium tagluense]|uniref:sensor histidine kinase n=1 Tax=Clostridium tagluense TaxID=360422 RepID=UPI001C0B18C0|nr:ATP-binding protein [Clostridium tagluense]MBU3129222.1 PAS domain S-box protein [Clostridium tagluense]MCB2310289.1 PAS domain S-box protein [Clostridium tagluense]MCB2315069.1 PAS domain S-box protein [Clostridium tagluense]MCB2319989.1 PAS domain S-box protein [Clostridium tagluense]MCB2324812.1 PAS domain S-box protein [Clostridium tagluense]